MRFPQSSHEAGSGPDSPARVLAACHLVPCAARPGPTLENTALQEQDSGFVRLLFSLSSGDAFLHFFTLLAFHVGLAPYSLSRVFGQKCFFSLIEVTLVYNITKCHMRYTIFFTLCIHYRVLPTVEAQFHLSPYS